MTPEEKFRKIERTFLEEWCKRNPMLGTSLGLPAFEESVPDGTVEAVAANVRFLEKAESDFAKIDPKPLPPAVQVDRDLAIHLCRLWRHELDVVRLWERRPEVPQVVGRCLHQVFARPWLPILTRLKPVIARLEKLPKYIQDARARLVHPVKYWIEVELDTLTRLPGFFNAVKESGRETIPPGQFLRINRALENLQNVLEDYTTWLIVDVISLAKDDFRLGASGFAALLEKRGLDATPDQILHQAQRELPALEKRLSSIAHEIRRGAPVDDIRETVRSTHASSFDETLRFVRDQVQKSKAFVIKNHHATVPPDEDMTIAETPVFLRHLCAFGTYFPPGRLSERQVGYLYVTAGEGEGDRLKEHNFAALTNFVAHHAYPGLHLATACANRNPSLLRTQAAAADTAEGWAAFAEELMKAGGFDNTPPAMFAHVAAQLRRAAEAVVEHGLQTGKTTVQQAVDHLVSYLGMDRLAATAEVRRITLNPGVAAATYLGKSRLLEIREDARKIMGKKFNPRYFHDCVLAAGAIPAKLLRREIEWRMKQALEKPTVMEETIPSGKGKGKAKGAKPAPAAEAKPATAGKTAAPAPAGKGKTAPAPAAKTTASAPAKGPAKKSPSPKKTAGKKPAAKKKPVMKAQSASKKRPAVAGRRKR